MATLTTIERDQLIAVTGGTNKKQQDQRILDKIQSLAGAVGDVAAQQQHQQPNPSAALMPLVAMKAMRQRQQ